MMRLSSSSLSLIASEGTRRWRITGKFAPETKSPGCCLTIGILCITGQYVLQNLICISTSHLWKSSFHSTSASLYPFISDRLDNSTVILCSLRFCSYVLLHPLNLLGMQQIPPRPLGPVGWSHYNVSYFKAYSVSPLLETLSVLETLPLSTELYLRIPSFFVHIL